MCSAFSTIFYQAVTDGNDMQGAAWAYYGEGSLKLGDGTSDTKWYSNVLADVAFTFPRNSAGPCITLQSD